VDVALDELSVDVVVLEQVRSVVEVELADGVVAADGGCTARSPSDDGRHPESWVTSEAVCDECGGVQRSSDVSAHAGRRACSRRSGA